MYFLKWALQNLKSRWRFTLSTGVFLIIVHFISIFSILVRDGSKANFLKSVSAFQGTVSANASETKGLGSDVVKELYKRFSSGKVMTVSSRTVYLVSSAGYFNVQVIASIRKYSSDSLLSNLSPALAWQSKSVADELPGKVYLPNNIAVEAGVKIGDSVNLLFERKKRNRSVSLQVGGIFDTSTLVNGRQIIVNESELSKLSPLVITSFQLFSMNTNDQWTQYKWLIKNFGEKLSISAPMLFPRESGLLSLFYYYFAFLSIIIVLFILASQGALALSLQNSMYLDFLKRREEFSVLRTLGLKNRYIVLLVVLQCIILSAATLIISTVLAIITGELLAEIKFVTSLNISELMNVLGGPGISIKLNLSSIGLYYLWSSTVLVIAGLTGLSHYLKGSIQSIRNRSK